MFDKEDIFWGVVVTVGLGILANVLGWPVVIQEQMLAGAFILGMFTTACIAVLVWIYFGIINGDD